MKFLWLFFTPFLSLKSNSQINHYDSLKKYTYMVVGIRGNNTTELEAYPLGSCFFVRRNNNLYFITANHLITGYDSFKGELEKIHYDTIGIRYFDENNESRLCIFSIEGVEDLFHRDFYYNNADVSVLQLTDSALIKNVFSIENYMNNEIMATETLDSVIAIGYGVIIKKTYSSKTPPIYGKGIKGKPTYVAPNDKQYQIENDSLFYAAQVNSWKGMSGSPAFLIYHYFKEDKILEHIIFGGEVFGGYKLYNTSLIVNPEIVELHIQDSPPIILNYISNQLPEKNP